MADQGLGTNYAQASTRRKIRGGDTLRGKHDSPSEERKPESSPGVSLAVRQMLKKRTKTSKTGTQFPTASIRSHHPPKIHLKQAAAAAESAGPATGPYGQKVKPHVVRSTINSRDASLSQEFSITPLRKDGFIVQHISLHATDPEGNILHKESAAITKSYASEYGGFKTEYQEAFPVKAGETQSKLAKYNRPSAKTRRNKRKNRLDIYSFKKAAVEHIIRQTKLQDRNTFRDGTCLCIKGYTWTEEGTPESAGFVIRSIPNALELPGKVAEGPPHGKEPTTYFRVHIAEGTFNKADYSLDGGRTFTEITK